jgi:hypothetical protein
VLLGLQTAELDLVPSDSFATARSVVVVVPVDSPLSGRAKKLQKEIQLKLSK